MKRYIIIYKNNTRLASVELTQENLKYLQDRFYLSFIQEDITGTLNYNVLDIKKLPYDRRK